MEEEIKQIQRMLREISFFDERIERVVPDGIYGEQTESSVRSFQRNNNLYETGVVDNDTWDKIIEEYNRVYRENKRNVQITVIDEGALPIGTGNSGLSLFVIQAMMHALSYEFSNLDEVEITGVYDERTQKAAEKIMIISGLEPKGELDREFINSLSELYMAYITENHIKNSSSISF